MQLESKIMSKKLTEISLDDVDFVNESLMDFYDSEETIVSTEEEPIEEEAVEEEPEEKVITTEEEGIITEEEVDEDSLDTDSKPPEKTSFDDYNNLALLALSLKEEDPDLLDFEIDKDLKPEQLVSSIKTQVEKAREQITQEVLEQYGQAANYLQMIAQGANQEDVQEALSYGQIAALELTGEEPEEVLENVVKAWLYRKGNSPEDINDFIELYKDKGILQDRAKESIQFHKEQEELYFKNWEAQRNQQIAEARQREAEYQRVVKSQIDKGVVKGLVIKDKKKFEEALFKPTETVEYIDNDGRKRLTKVPLIQVKTQNLNNDIEQQLALQFLLLQDFDFTSLVDTAKRKVNNNLVNILNERVNSTPDGRKTSIKYFED